MGPGNLHLAPLFFVNLWFGQCAFATANSTQSRHVHNPNWDATKYTDGKIILILGVVVCMTFALGLLSQLCEISILSCLRNWRREDDAYPELNPVAQRHRMSDLEAGGIILAHNACDIPIDLAKKGSNVSLAEYPRWKARYGTITEHMLDVNGVRKLVLVVDHASLPSDSDRAQDGYAEWFGRWRQQQEAEASFLDAMSQPFLDDEFTPLMGPIRDDSKSDGNYLT
ncbi:hypothetical protein BDW59DRAFT_12955 [Aspergillus cavernicola]|uniref:Uncharacterized protein n=1 Tax=Aspergillus cavernicola TaxID=176166 RepID=A0ABR4HM61_9EURO